MGTSPKPKFRTGNKDLDHALLDIHTRALTADGRIAVRSEIKLHFSILDNQIDFLSRRGHTLAEVYYLALLAKRSGKKINDVAALHSKGVGWGVLAKRLGVRPSDLNKLRVQIKKNRKAAVKRQKIIKEQKKIKNQVKINCPEKPPAKKTNQKNKGRKK
jgi:hypothetical protein